MGFGNVIAIAATLCFGAAEPAWADVLEIRPDGEAVMISAPAPAPPAAVPGASTNARHAARLAALQPHLSPSRRASRAEPAIAGGCRLDGVPLQSLGALARRRDRRDAAHARDGRSARRRPHADLRQCSRRRALSAAHAATVRRRSGTCARRLQCRNQKRSGAMAACRLIVKPALSSPACSATWPRAPHRSRIHEPPASFPRRRARRHERRAGRMGAELSGRPARLGANPRQHQLDPGNVARQCRDRRRG